MTFSLVEARARRAGSLGKLTGALPELLERERLLAAKCEAEGIVYVIPDFGGMRNAAQTALILKYRETDYKAAVKADPRVAQIPITVWRRIAPYGTSAHNYGAGFDVNPILWPLGMTFGTALQRIAELAPTVGLRNGASFQDIRHQEIPASLAEWKARWIGFTAERVITKSPMTAAVVLIAVSAAALLFARMRG